MSGLGRATSRIFSLARSGESINLEREVLGSERLGCINFRTVGPTAAGTAKAAPVFSGL